MKKITLIMLMGALVAFFALPSFTSQSQQKASSEEKTYASPSVLANLENLQNAYESEITASAKYAAYADKATEEGRHEIALLFKAVSKASGIHSENTKAVLKDAGQSVPVIEPEFTVNSTMENLRDAVFDENYETETMYPEYVIQANKARHQPSMRSLNFAYLTSQKHKVLFEKAVAAMKNYNLEPLASKYYVCATCGNIYENTAPSNCEISQTTGIKFYEIPE